MHHFDEKEPINRIKIPHDTIRSYDMESTMTVELYSQDEKSKVNDLAFFIVSNDDDHFTNIDDYEVNDGTVTFRMPKLERGRYYPQIMDNKGQVYSSLNSEYIDVVYNQESRKMELFPIIKNEIIDEMEPRLKKYIMDNKDYFVGGSGTKGEKGDKGEPGPQGPRGYQGNRGPMGYEGPQGEQGPEGPQGLKGYQGNRGPMGPEGPEGPQGPKGDPGNVDFEALTEEQIQMLTGPQGPQGEQGPEGPQGPVGETQFSELTPEQIEMLKGEKGDPAPIPEFTLDGDGNLYLIHPDPPEESVDPDNPEEPEEPIDEGNEV